MLTSSINRMDHTGGRLSPIELGAFLNTEAKGPEHQALLRLIGTLVEVPPYA